MTTPSSETFELGSEQIEIPKRYPRREPCTLLFMDVERHGQNSPASALHHRNKFILVDGYQRLLIAQRLNRPLKLRVVGTCSLDEYWAMPIKSA